MHNVHQLIPVPSGKRRCRKLTESIDSITGNSATADQSSPATAQASINTENINTDEEEIDENKEIIEDLINQADATNGQKVGFSSRDFLYTVAAVYQMAHDGNYKFGDSDSDVPCDDKKISGDRLISRSLWNLGFRDQPPGGKELPFMDQYLLDHGFIQITEQSQIQSGDIVITTPDDGDIRHNEIMVVVSYDHQTGMCYKYQTTKYTTDGEYRIKCEQPFHTQLVENSNERKYRFKVAYRIP